MQIDFRHSFRLFFPVRRFENLTGRTGVFWLTVDSDFPISDVSLPGLKSVKKPVPKAVREEPTRRLEKFASPVGQDTLAQATKGRETADQHSPLVLQQLAAAQEKLGNTAGAEAARTCLKYHRSSETEWFLATQGSSTPN